MPKILLNDLIIPKYIDVLYDMIDHKHTHYILYGGRGGTKSTFAAIALVYLLIQPENKNSHAICFRKIANTLRDSVYANILFAISILGLDSVFKKAVSPMEVTYIKTGQKILFRGVDEPEKIKSIKMPFGYIGITHFEESSNFHGREEIRNVLQSTMRGENAKFINIETFNPPRSRDAWANVDMLEQNNDKLTVNTSYLDVPKKWLSDQFIAEAERLKEDKPQAYLNEYMGIPTGTGGIVFDNIQEQRILDSEIKEMGRFKFGCDFGFSVDPFVWIKMHYNRDKQILYILDEVYEVRLKNASAVQKIRQKHSNNMLIWADSAEPRTIAEMKALGLNIEPAKKGPDSVEHGMKFLEGLIKIVIDKSRTPNAYREFSLYEYAVDRNGNYISAYPDKNNHCIDAVRYGMSDEIQVIRPIMASGLRLYGVR